MSLRVDVTAPEHRGSRSWTGPCWDLSLPLSVSGLRPGPRPRPELNAELVAQTPCALTADGSELKHAGPARQRPPCFAFLKRASNAAFCLFNGADGENPGTQSGPGCGSKLHTEVFRVIYKKKCTLWICCFFFCLLLFFI